MWGMSKANTLKLISIVGLLIWLGFTANYWIEKKYPQLNQISLPRPQVLSETIEKTATPSAEMGKMPTWARVTNVIDGDTIEVEVDQQKHKVRYVGVNTPETVDPRRPVQCFGKEASNQNRQLVNGKMVLLTVDITEQDKYQRWLRYVYLPQEDGSWLFVNDYLVRAGYAYTYPYPPDVRFDEKFKEAEKEAREGNLGLWSKCGKGS